MQKIHEKIVLVGGGGGVYCVARFLKHIREEITTIQTMFDRGGHSGKLRDERGVLPPGDIRQAILALSNDSMEQPLRELLAYRFPSKNGSSIDDATMGNFMITALSDICGGPIQGIKAMSKIFQVTGRVLPVSLDESDLCAKLSDGSILKGEGLIDTRSPDDQRQIKLVYLEPSANIFVESYRALIDADKIVFCPGDLYTSIIPNVLVNGFKEAIAESKAMLIYVVNLMTKKAETDKYSSACFARVLLEYLGRDRFDAVICNNKPIRQDIVDRYKKEQAEPVVVNQDVLEKYTDQIIMDDVANQTGHVLRHNSKVAKIIADL